MQDLNRALDDIKTLRTQLARGTQFRGYGPITVAVTGALAAAGAILQSQILSTPIQHIAAWLTLWVSIAILSVLLIGAEVVFRARRAHAGLADDMIQEAALQLLPAAGAGMLLTAVLWRYAPQSLPLLPGLWQIILSLGIFSACRTLPPRMALIAFFYLLTGLVTLTLATGPHALSPYAMGAPFAAGEALAAIFLLSATAQDHA